MGKWERFNPKWETSHAVEVVQRHAITAEVSGVRCRFCHIYGKERSKNANNKRAVSNITMYWESRDGCFRADYFSEHHKTMHCERWKEYKSLSVSEKKTYLSMDVNDAVVVARSSSVSRKKAKTISDHFRINTEEVDIEVHEDIVKGAMCELINVVPKASDEYADLLVDVCRYDQRAQLRSSDTDSRSSTSGGSSSTTTSVSARQKERRAPKNKKSAIDRLFKKVSPDDPDCYVMITTVKNRRLYNLVKDFIAVGNSFVQIVSNCRSIMENLDDPRTKGMNQEKVSDFTYIYVAAHYQTIRDVLAITWAFSLGLDGGNNQDVPYLDVRIRFTINGRIHNLHLCAIPVYEAHNAAVFFEKVSKLLQSIVGDDWKIKLIGYTSDGASVMLGHHTGLVARIRAVVAMYGPFYVIWCLCHQIDLLAKRYLKFAYLCSFLAAITTMTNYISRCSTYFEETGSTVPLFSPTRWLGASGPIAYFLYQKAKVVRFLTQKNQAHKLPDDEWYLYACVMNHVMQKSEKSVGSLQAFLLTCDEQKEKLQQLIRWLTVEFNLVYVDESDTRTLNVDECKFGTVICTGKKIETFIQGPGRNYTTRKICERYIDGTDDVESDYPTFQTYCRSIASDLAQYVHGLRMLSPERDEENKADVDMPPVLPSTVVTLDKRQFGKLLDSHEKRLLHTYDEVFLSDVSNQFDSFLHQYKTIPVFKAQVDAKTESFHDCWKPFYRQFTELVTFLGGVATVFPNNASIESDFSMIGINKDEYKKSLKNVPLEGILQAKQKKEIKELQKWLVSLNRDEEEENEVVEIEEIEVQDDDDTGSDLTS
eukprot:CAMPEP_0178978182 /NCGR_PEP_ID=MMETSP0789-20121207/24988_1 /TAXON_ID=3005 /ORGANISM="Rhizosolenia setigera, Strain CCMP 1694" /LENGTH=819 /DNA_ID=CAMNT_0020667835 /DNA_START=114 /DNA_END=2573 /DNA_ORIENTATION=+